VLKGLIRILIGASAIYLGEALGAATGGTLGGTVGEAFLLNLAGSLMWPDPLGRYVLHGVAGALIGVLITNGGPGLRIIGGVAGMAGATMGAGIGFRWWRKRKEPDHE
jgi:hypothetical protein